MLTKRHDSQSKIKSARGSMQLENNGHFQTLGSIQAPIAVLGSNKQAEDSRQNTNQVSKN